MNDFPKNEVVRRAETPGEILFIWNTVDRIKFFNPGCKVAIVGIPLRMKGTTDQLKLLNYIISQVPADCRYFGVGRKISAVSIVVNDEVHLSEISLSYSKSILGIKSCLGDSIVYEICKICCDFCE